MLRIPIQRDRQTDRRTDRLRTDRQRDGPIDAQYYKQTTNLHLQYRLSPADGGIFLPK